MGVIDQGEKFKGGYNRGGKPKGGNDKGEKVGGNSLGGNCQGVRGSSLDPHVLRHSTLTITQRPVHVCKPKKFCVGDSF